MEYAQLIIAILQLLKETSGLQLIIDIITAIINDVANKVDLKIAVLKQVPALLEIIATKLPPEKRAEVAKLVYQLVTK